MVSLLEELVEDLPEVAARNRVGVRLASAEEEYLRCVDEGAGETELLSCRPSCPPACR